MLSKVPFRLLAMALTGAAVLIWLGVGGSRFGKQQHNEAYQVGIIINSIEISAADMEVVKLIIRKKLEEVNRTGGLAGRRLQAIYLDDKGSEQTLYKLVQETSSNPNLIAYIGCRSSLRAKAIAPLVNRRQVPFIGGFSLTSVNAPYPNIYSMDVSMKEVSVVLRNLLQQRATRAAFIGKTGDLYSEALLRIMQDYELENPGFKVVMQQRFAIDYNYSETDLRQLADSLKARADFLLLSTEQGPTNQILAGLWRHKVHLPVFTGLADMAQVKPELPGYEAGELYDVGILGIPGAMNARLQERLNLYKRELGEGGNLEFQVGYGGRHADAIGLLKEAVQNPEASPELPIRERICRGLVPYIRGNQIFHGWFGNWYFTADRTFAGDELLAWKPASSTAFMLAPFQHLRKDEALEPAPVIYTSINLVNIGQENDEAGTFDATFYLELTSAANHDIRQLDFANAARNALNHEPLIEAKLIRSKTESADRPFYNYLYKVSGKFMFDPDLRTYPFDEQKFPITIHTGKSAVDFLVQPPEEAMRDHDFESEGWIYQDNYVGYDQDIIATDTSFSSTIQKNIPLYKFSFVYVLKRARIDFTLKTLVPLLAILIISYFSVYIPAREFEAMAAIQVTSLLSAIALFFATSKPEMPYATISDKIFIFSYIMITSLIGTSVLLYVMYRKSSRLKRLARLYQRLVFPLIVIGFTIYIRF